MLALLLTLAAASPAESTTVQADTQRYAVMMGSGTRAAGSGRAWRTADGELRYTYEFNDRGRGPKLETRVRLDADGRPVLIETSGVDYYKNAVTDRFTLENGRASWKNSTEEGQKAVSAPAAYLPIYSATPGDELVRALLAAGGALDLLPEGRATLERAGELEVSAGGRTQRVVQYLVSGLGFEPQPVWLTPEGEFFMSGGEWIATVREGWEAALPALFAAQRAAEEARAGELARRLARRPARPLVFRGVSLFDPESRQSRPGTTVVVRGGRIEAVGPDASTAVPADAEVVDGRGKTLLPGLWDMHAHVSPLDGPLNLAAGVTSVRDLANDTATVLGLRRRWDAGESLGPRLPVMAGFIDGPGPFTGPVGPKPTTPDEARAAVDEYARLGFQQIKVYSSLDTALLPVVIEHAHRRGLRVSGHIPWPMTAERAVRLGIDELQHANFLALNFLGDSLDTRTPARFTAVARGAAGLDLRGEAWRGFVRLLKERDVVVDPTLAVFEDMFTARLGEVSPSFASVVGRFPPNVRRGVRLGGLPVPDGMDARYRESHRRLMQMTADLHRAGVRLVAGTDGLAGFTLHRELELYAEAGIPPGDVLYIATLGAARVAKQDDRLGTIAPGKLADLVLVDGDPLTRISDIRRTRLVVKDGVVYEPDALYSAIGVGPVGR
ncbi:MAG TPA: amidohydrolase family protein [Longimicrobium sp.]|jgi:imidazolonepropionase-like amidohydrolase